MNLDDQTKSMRSFIDEEHFRYRRFGDEAPADAEVQLTSDWGLILEAPSSPLLDSLEADFRTFCRRCLQLEFGTSNAGQPRIRWLCAGDQVSQENFDRQDPSVESFAIDVGEREVVIEAGHQRGLLQGTHYLERMMADRGAPLLPVGRIERTPIFTPRITNGIFIESDQNIADPNQFSDAYFGLMSHFGGNGIHLFTDLWSVCRSDILPELNAPDFDAQVAALKQLCARANARGIDVYLCVVMELLSEDHEVFRAHPEVRGASAQIMDRWDTRYCLCSGSDTVLAFYEESIANLFRALPEVAGMLALVGGEGFFHCFTRPGGDFEGKSTCPHCRDRDPSQDVAELVNRVAAAVKASGSHKAFYAWPYSAFVWSGSEDRAQHDWMGRLSADVSVLTNFATGSRDPVNDDGVFLYDYNIKSVGPSEIFAAQRRRLQELGRPIYAKIESCTTPLFFGVPYLPLHQRWHRRAMAMTDEPVAGFVGQWRFYGMNGSPPEELQYHATWNPDVPAETLLLRMARRDFGVSDADAKRVVAGWESLSRAWDDIPYSAMLCGERAFYMRGPLYLGPAHPLIFDPQNNYGLSTRFRTLRGDAYESIGEQELEQMKHNAPPRYVDQLMFAMPYGEERFLELIARCRARWEEGLRDLREILQDCPAARARMELDVCEIVGIHLATVEHVARFYRFRDGLWRNPVDREHFAAAIAELIALAEAEADNARRSLPILERDPRIAFNACYGNPYDAEMVREKIAQCETLIEHELPQYSRQVRFHLWMEFP